MTSTLFSRGVRIGFLLAVDVDGSSQRVWPKSEHTRRRQRAAAQLRRNGEFHDSLLHRS